MKDSLIGHTNEQGTLTVEQLSMKDYLTGLDRYEVFLEKLEENIKQIGDRRITIVYTDIKYFKYINETYGYQVGDALLKDFVAEMVKENNNLLCCARVYSDNFVSAGFLREDLSNEEFRNLIYRVFEQQASVLHRYQYH